MFSLSAESITQIVSKMITHEELFATFDQEFQMISIIEESAIGQQSRLEYLEHVYADKLSALIENNEKLVEAKNPQDPAGNSNVAYKSRLSQVKKHQYRKSQEIFT